ncbi:MAG: flippase-like domain-containing protein [Chitinophagaceae bacterium]|nr:flippase-like domain-containing protein [Chitinophagaceae bacterium]
MLQGAGEFDYFVAQLRIRNKNIKIILNYVVGPLLFCLLAYSIYTQILRQPDWQQSFSQIKNAFDSTAIWKMILVGLLMLANWGIEARKWQLVISRIQPIGWMQCLKAVFTGTTLAFFTPNRMGEYIGRVLYIDPGKRVQAISLTLVCSMGQLMVTLFFGITGLLALKALEKTGIEISNSALFWLDTVLYGSLIALAFLTLLYFRFSRLVRWIERIPKIERVLSYIRVLDNFNATMLFQILSLSVVRYLVFALQYYLLFQVFKVELSGWQVFWSVSVVFLVLAIVPTIALVTELGVRWKTSIEIVQLFSLNTVGILATSLTIWIINLVIPALIGSLLILNIRLFNYKEGQKRMANKN